MLIGRPIAMWKDQVSKDMQKKGLEKEDPRNGERWRWVVGEAKYQFGYEWSCQYK